MNFFKALFARKQPRRHGFVPTPEPLGDRTLPAITSLTFLNGVLTIRCNNANDVVRVRQDHAGNIYVNGATARDAKVLTTKDIRIYGNGGHDLLEIKLPGYSGFDVLDGGDGNDTLVGGHGPSLLYGGANDDDLTGGLNDDEIIGGSGFNRLIEQGNVGFTLTNLLLRDPGTDSLQGISRAYLTGGSGSHRYDTRAFTGRVFIDGRGGNDTILSGPGRDTLFGGGGDDYIDGGGGDDQVWGLAGNDWVIGHAGDDTLYGNAGNDYLVGDRGDDTLYGGADFDTILDTGDAITLDDTSLAITRILPGGTTAEFDTHNSIEAAILYTVGTGPARIDAALFTGPVTLTGGPGNDILIGGSDDDVIDGYGGDDLILGNAGNDHLMGKTGRDLLVGGSGADVLEGGAGEDILIAGATVWDARHRSSPWELKELHDDWRRMDLDYEQRISNQLNGVGVTQARLSPFGWNAGGSLVNDFAHDVLTGGADLDVFFWRLGEDTPTDRIPHDQQMIYGGEHWLGV